MTNVITMVFSVDAMMIQATDIKRETTTGVYCIDSTINPIVYN